MTVASLDKYDKIYEKYSHAIDPPSFIEPPGHKIDSQQDEAPIKVGLKSALPTKVGLKTASYKATATSPELDVTPLDNIKLPSTTTQRSTQDRIIARYQIDPPEPKHAVASRDDDDDDNDIRPAKQSDEESSRDDIALTMKSMQIQSSLDRFNAKRKSMRKLYGSPSASISAASKGSDPPSNDLYPTLKYLTEQSMGRRATIFPSKPKSGRNAKAKKAHVAWDPMANTIPHKVPPISSSEPMKSLAIKIIGEQTTDRFRMTHDKCSDCANYLVEGSGVRKCVFCPINDFRAIVQSAVSNRVMASKRIQGDSLIVSDGKCAHCYSPTQEGISCEVCPLLDDICIDVATAIGRGGVLSYSSCNDCGSQYIRSSDGVQHCIVCNVLKEKLGEQQLYKPHKAIDADASPLQRYQDTLHETTELLEKIQKRDNESIQIQLDEELVKAKNAQSLLGATMANIAHESKTRGIRSELKEELLKAKEAQLTLQKMLESNNSANKAGAPVVQDEKTVISYTISQREIDRGNVKEYIPPPKYFFQRGVPKTINVKDGSNTLHQERKEVADCCGVRIHKQPSYVGRAESYDDDSIDTGDQYTVDVSLNSYESKLFERRHESRNLPIEEYFKEEKSSKGRSQRWSIFNLCGCGASQSFDKMEAQEPNGRLDESIHTYGTDYRTHRKYSFDTEDDYQRVLRNIHRDDDSSYDASMYSNITPQGILRSSRHGSSYSVMSDDQSSRMSMRGQRRSRGRSGNSVFSGSESKRASFYNRHQRDLDHLKTLTEEGDDYFQPNSNSAVEEVKRTIADYKTLSR